MGKMEECGGVKSGRRISEEGYVGGDGVETVERGERESVFLMEG